MKVKDLIIKILCIVFGVMAFVSMLLPFLILKTTTDYGVGAITNTNTVSFSRWWEVLQGDSERLWANKIAAVLMIFVFVLIALIITFTIIRFFVNKKMLNKINKVVAILCIVASILFIIFFIIGCFLQFSSTKYSLYTVMPHAGPIVILVAGLVASICSLISLKRK